MLSCVLILQRCRLHCHVIKNDIDPSVQGLPASQQKIMRPAKQDYHFFAKVIVWFTKFSQFEEYPIKHGKTEIYKLIKTNSAYKSHKPYANACMFIFISLNN